MKKLTTNLALFFILIIPSTMVAEIDSSDYETLLSAEVRRSREKVTQLIVEMGSTLSTSPAERLVLETRLAALQVKEILLQNFSGTSSMKNPDICKKLLALIKQPSISTDELQELQNLVMQSKTH